MFLADIVVNVEIPIWLGQWGVTFGDTRRIWIQYHTCLSVQSSSRIQIKEKCTPVQALRLCTSRTAHRGSRGIALPFLDHGSRRGWGVSVTPWPLFTPGKDPVPIVQEAGWASGPIWTDAKNLVPARIRSPDRPAHSQLLYWLHYPVNRIQIGS
jgi:hypothetical protein